MDTAKLGTLGRSAEAQIDAFIERRSRNGETDPDEQEELWVESVRRHNTRQREELRLAWREYHRHLQLLHQNLADEHEAEAQKLCGEDQGGCIAIG